MSELEAVIASCFIIVNIITMFTHPIVTLADNVSGHNFITKYSYSTRSRLELIIFLFIFNNSIYFTERTYDIQKLYNVYTIYDKLSIFGKILFFCDRNSVIKEKSRDMDMVVNPLGLLFVFKFVLLPMLLLIHTIALIYRLSVLPFQIEIVDGFFKNLAVKKSITKSNESLKDIYK